MTGQENLVINVWGDKNYMNLVNYKINTGDSLRVDIEIPSFESLEKHHVWNMQPTVNVNKTIQKLNPSIPNEGGVYFLFYSDNRLLYVGKAANIRQKLNDHTKTRTIQEIAEQKRRNPRHICSVSWLMLEDDGAKEIIKTAYLRVYGTAWNQEKIDNNLTYPPAPEDEEYNLPEVQAYLKKEKNIMDKAIEAIGV